MVGKDNLRYFTESHIERTATAAELSVDDVISMYLTIYNMSIITIIK